SGRGTSYTVTLTTNTGFSGLVSFSVTGLPANTSGVFSPTSLSGPGNSILSVTTGTNTPSGTNTLTIKGAISGVATNTVTVEIMDAAASHPRINSVVMVGQSLVLGGTNGVAGWSYCVLASTNVAAPVASWTRIATNEFDSAGRFSFSTVVNPALPQQFYMIQL